MAQNFRTHLILYSRSALIELLEHSGFEIDSIGPDFEYRDHRFLRHSLATRWPVLAPLVRRAAEACCPIRCWSAPARSASSRSAAPARRSNIRAIRSVEPTHAR